MRKRTKRMCTFLCGCVHDVNFSSKLPRSKVEWEFLKKKIKKKKVKHFKAKVSSWNLFTTFFYSAIQKYLSDCFANSRMSHGTWIVFCVGFWEFWNINELWGKKFNLRKFMNVIPNILSKVNYFFCLTNLLRFVLAGWDKLLYKFLIKFFLNKMFHVKFLFHLRMLKLLKNFWVN